MPQKGNKKHTITQKVKCEKNAFFEIHDGTVKYSLATGSNFHARQMKLGSYVAMWSAYITSKNHYDITSRF